MLLRVLRVILNNSLKYMNYNGMTREEFVRIFGPEQLDKYKPVPRTPTFVMSDTINNKAQIALKSTPYEPPRCRQRIKRRFQKQNEQPIVQEKILEHKPEPVITINHLASMISLLKLFKEYVSNNSSSFSCVLNINSISSYNTFTNVCDAICITLQSDHSNILEKVHDFKTNENILLVNAIVSETFDTITFNQQSYKYNIVSNCINNEDYNILPSELPYRLNTASIDTLKKVNNFMIIKNYSNFNTKARFLLTAKNLQYDMLIIEPYYNKGHYFTASDIEFMKYKKGNKLNRRLVYAYLDMSHLHEQSKFYSETFMENDTIKYWSDEWKDTLFARGEGSITDYFIKSGYDGVFVDNIKE
jgi:hypothetical protein